MTFYGNFFLRPTQRVEKTSSKKFSMPTLMFYNRMNVHIVQVFSSCEKVIEAVKRKFFWGKSFRRPLMASQIFSMPTL